MKNATGQKIRRIRQRRELTQENVAYELGITKGAYAKIERGETNASVKRLEQIAKVLEVSVTEFFEAVQTADPKNQYGFATKGDIEEVVKMIQGLTKEVNILKESFNKKNSAIKKSKK